MLVRVLPSLLLASTAVAALRPPQWQPSRRAVLMGSSIVGLAAVPRALALESDIAVTIVEAGDLSSPLAQKGQTAVVDYTLWLNGFGGQRVDGNRGFAFKVGVGQVIKGWDQTVGEMRVGERRRVVIPSSLGYGPNGVGPIPGGASLYFDIALRELKATKEQLAAQAEAEKVARSPSEQSKVDRQALIKQVRAERMAEEARRQNEEYVRIQSGVGTKSFGSTVTVR